MKSQEEAQSEIIKLESVKGRLHTKRSMFGDNHEHAIEGQIEVLRERLDDDAVYDRIESEELNDNVADAMRDAVNWLEETGEIESLADQWEELANPA